MQALIMSDHEAIAGRVRQVLLFEGLDCPAACFATNDNAAQSLAKAQPDLVVMVLGPQTEHVLQVLGELRRLVQTRILVVGPASSKLVLRALRGGADDYVDETDLEAELQAALKRLNEARDAAARRPGGSSPFWPRAAAAGRARWRPTWRPRWPRSTRKSPSST